ncbi:hypothetical protein PIB30_107988, partial [Stylosanthes scabra]|nr:hypothetical protein [Stylosanthes scabra]
IISYAGLDHHEQSLRFMPGKLRSRWEGPYKAKTVFPFGLIELEKRRTEPPLELMGIE